MLNEKSVETSTSRNKTGRRKTKKQDASLTLKQMGRQIRKMRKAHRLSMRDLAELSGLSVNTLGLIENAKTSPNVSTLHQLAQSLGVQINAFFEYEHSDKTIFYQRAGERKQLIFSQGQVEKLSEGMPYLGSEPFIAKLEPGANSGDTPIEFPGREFIYCLEGHITYIIEDETYPLSPGDSLIFDAYIPHAWRNTGPANSSALLVVCPEESFEDFPEHYLMP